MNGPIRFILFVLAGAAIGGLLGLMATAVVGTGSAIEEYFINTIIGMIGGGLLGIIGHLLTRKAEGGSVVPSATTRNVKSNILRKGSSLVVPVTGAVFPNRCVKTGVPVDAADYCFASTLSPGQLRGGTRTLAEIAARVAFGRGGAVAAKAINELANSVPLEYYVGLCEAKRRGRKLQTIWSTVLLLGFAPFLLLAVPVANVVKNADGSPYFPAIVPFIVISVAMFVGGIILFALRSNLLSLQHCDGDYVWIAGASKEFLDTLPEAKFLEC